MGSEAIQAPQTEKHEAALAEQAAQAQAAGGGRSYCPPHGLNMAGAGSPDDIPLTRDNLLLLQRAVGNRAVADLLHDKGRRGGAADRRGRGADPAAAPVVWRRPARPETATPPGRPFRSPSNPSAPSEPELKVEAPRPAGPVIQRQCACGGGKGGAASHGECSGCRKKQPLQRRARDDESAPEPSLPPSVKDVVGKQGGEPLPDSTRASMESALGADLGGVRLHTGAGAARAAADINAEAFTLGQDVYFGAGRYDPDTTAGTRLLAHELTHTVQQRDAPAAPATSDYGVSMPDDPQEVEAEAVADRVVSGEASSNISRTAAGPARIHRYSLAEFGEDLGSVGESLGDAAGDAADAVASGAEAVGEGLAAAGEAVVEGAGAVVEAGAGALDWLATEAGQLATEIASALGVSVRITPAGLVIDVPSFCPLPAFLIDIDLPGLDLEYMTTVFGLPIGANFALTGRLGLTAAVEPEMQVQVGPVCLNASILINPLTNTYAISGGLSATVAMALGAEVRGGVRGELGLTALIPVGPLIVPITAPLVGAEGGLAGMARVIGAATYTLGESLAFGGGSISLAESRRLELGAAADLFAGAYAELDVRGQHVCRIYWQPYEWHGDTAIALTSAASLTITPGGTPTIGVVITPPSLSSIPFGNIPLVIGREGFSDDCPIVDRLCEILDALNLFPSRRGGSWSWSGPYGPGPRLPGPLDVYVVNPGIASGALCRGACGWNCAGCESHPVHHYTDPLTGEVWEYTNFQECNTHEGCQQHDAGFDWAADTQGETGDLDIIMPWHMAANIECLCNTVGGNCIAWALGFPPFTGEIFFADSARVVAGSTTVITACQEEHPGAILCTEPNSDRDAVLGGWGALNQIGNFRDCRMVSGPTSPGLEGCDGAAGSVWHCTATDLPTGLDFTVSINECECCSEDGTFGSEWRDPQVVVTDGMSDELKLSLCERKLITQTICGPLEQEMIERYGNENRDMERDPDTARGRTRIDDAPIVETFQGMYNRLDSWYFFIRGRHSEWLDEFRQNFNVGTKADLRSQWLSQIKERGDIFKDKYRNVERHDVENIQQKYRDFVLEGIQEKIDELITRIATWYKAKTGSSESLEELTARAHKEGTEIWREEWRKAILQVNRVLDRLWPPAKSEIIGWIDQQRQQHPDVDLTGEVGKFTYIGSLASGIKSPAKQFARFNPEKFDVDANVEAPPLAKYAMAIDNLKPKHERIFSRVTTIRPLIDFAEETQEELVAKVPGYDNNPDDPFDVVIAAPELPEQERFRLATERLYKMRETMDAAAYAAMVQELKAAGLVVSNEDETGQEIRRDLTVEQYQQLNAILDKYQ